MGLGMTGKGIGMTSGAGRNADKRGARVLSFCDSLRRGLEQT